MDRHEVPTHLMVPDKAVFGLTARQIGILGIGLIVAYTMWNALTLGPLGVTMTLRIISGSLIVGSTVAIAFVVIAHQPLEAWISHALRYQFSPKRRIWQPIQQPIAEALTGGVDDEEA